MKSKFKVGQKVIFRKEKKCRISAISKDGKQYKINYPHLTNYWFDEDQIEAHL
jgi:hypothetical protein